MMVTVKNLIGGELTDPISKMYSDNFDPATGTPFSKCPDSDGADVDRAVSAASLAFPKWSKLSVTERSVFLKKLSLAIQENFETFCKLETQDTGKPISLSRTLDIPRSSKNFDFFADVGISEFTETYSSPNMLNYTIREPLGVVGVISPWNLPLYLLTWKIAPALITGNCVVAKPSEVTPMTAFLFSELAQKILPPGVLNIVHGTGAKVGNALTGHKGVRAISFTGSTKTGREIYKNAATTFKKVSLEMGGKNPTLVFADCDFEKTIEGVLKASFQNQGQVCLCGERILIEEKIYNQFRDALVLRTKSLKVGDPDSEETEQGSVISKIHYEKIISYFELAKKEGGVFLTGGKARKIPGRCENGWFIEPTIIEGLSNTCRTNQEEIFGPVVTLQSFKNDDEAIFIANQVEYGLASSVWTGSLERGHRMAKDIKSGVVWINSWMLRDLRIPFGGMKNSGLGREGGSESMKFFTEYKTVCVSYENI